MVAARSLPAASPRLARSNPLTAILAHQYGPNMGGPRALVDTAGRANGVLGSGNTWQVDSNGPYVNFDDSATGANYNAALNIGDAAGSGSPGNSVSFGLVFRVMLTAYTFVNAAGTALPGAVYGAGQGSIELRTTAAGKLELLKSGIASLGVSTATVPLYTVVDIGFAWINGLLNFYINGIFAGSASPGAQTFTLTGQHQIGYASPNSSSYERVANGFRFYKGAVFNRAPSAGQMKSWSDNPDQTYEAENDDEYVIQSADTSLSGGAAAASIATGALTTSIRLSGAAPAAASATGALTTAVPLAGAAAAAASASGTLAGGAAALSGNASAAASASGTLSTSIPLAGAAVSQASASGTMAGAGAALAGSAAAVAGGTGALKTSIALSGTAGAQATAAAVLTTKVALAGAGAAQAVAAGTLSAGATVPGIDISQISPAHIAVFDGSGSRIAVFDGTGTRTLINGMTMKLPTPVNGKMTVDRDPDEISWYGADITQELIDRATTPLDQTKVVPILEGVALLQGPLIQTATVGGVTRTYVVVLLGGVDGPLPDDWHWIARVPCTNSERFDKTTYFNKVDT